MLDVDQRHQGLQSSIAQWIYRVIGFQGLRLRVRLRGNDLHVLCESQQCPAAITVVPSLLRELDAVEGVLPETDSRQPIYQIILYGRAVGSEQPEWIEPIHLNQLERHLERWQIAKEADISDPETPITRRSGFKKESALIVSNESLARSGAPDAIARYLSETLSPLGVGVKVFIQNLPNKQESKGLGETNIGKQGKILSTFQSEIQNPKSKIQNSERRLWIICDSEYSPDPSLLAEPVTQRLRNLKLEGFVDAVIKSQVSGEAKPDWLLRVDLTPPEEMLRDWARWGDVQALMWLLNQHLADRAMQVRAVLKETTLHLFCSWISSSSATSVAPSKEQVIKAIAPLLESIAPQAIHRATIYGIKSEHQNSNADQEKPVWVEFLSLPASEHPALAETPSELARQGDQPALLFLLQRLIHPDLDWRLSTGGIRIQIHRKRDLLHIMTDAPLCPLQSQVGPPVAKYIRQLRMPKVAGVRVYGRRAGQLSPLWKYGIDFITRQKKQPEPTPEFAATAALSESDIQYQLGEDLLLSPEDIPPEKSETQLSATVNNFGKTIEQLLLASQLFIPGTVDQDLASVTPSGSSATYSTNSGVKVALVWGLLGLLLTIQSDWLIGQILRYTANSASLISAKDKPRPAPKLSPTPVSIPQISLQKSKGKKATAFNASTFTREGDTSVIISNPRGNASTVAILAAARSLKPSFNNRLLDEKLALYEQRLIQNGGTPPDVLIVGSSRAMRGIDPTALKTALAIQGYPDIDIFNFGVNGATAQVVELILRRVLTTSQLPKLIIWADGARAFNSGRIDLTYEAIVTSPGYSYLDERELKGENLKLEKPNQPLNSQPKNNLQPTTASTINSWLNQTLGDISATYSQREQLKSLLTKQFANLTPNLEKSSPITEDAESLETAFNISDSIDFDGFLPLTFRFNPTTYYKKYSKVTGDYDTDYESFSLDGKQDQALSSLLEFVQTHQVPLVFVNLPLTKEYLDSVRTKHEQEFQEYMQQVAIQNELIFRDMSQAWITKNENFSDPSHLNQYGAYEVSNQLAKDPMIPWPTK